MVLVCNTMMADENCLVLFDVLFGMLVLFMVVPALVLNDLFNA